MKFTDQYHLAPMHGLHFYGIYSLVGEMNNEQL